MPILRNTTVRRKERHTSSERTFVDSLDLDRASVKVNCRVPTSLTAYFTSISLAFSRGTHGISTIPLRISLRSGQIFALPLRYALQVLYSRLCTLCRSDCFGAIFQKGRKKEKKKNHERSNKWNKKRRRKFPKKPDRKSRKRERERVWRTTKAKCKRRAILVK